MKTFNDFETLIHSNLALLGIGKEQLEIFSDGGSVLPGSNHETEHGLHYLDIEYRLVLDIENMPGPSFGLLCLLVKRFVDGLDRDELKEIEMDFTPHDRGVTVDTQFSFGVRDPIHLVEVQESPIVFGGKKWGFGEGGLDVAESLRTVSAN